MRQPGCETCRFTRARAGLEEDGSNSEMNHVVVASATCVCCRVSKGVGERERKMQVHREGGKVFPVARGEVRA